MPSGYTPDISPVSRALVLPVLAVMLLGTALAAMQYWQQSRLIDAAGDALFASLSQRVQQSLNTAYRAPIQSLNLLALEPLDDAHTLEDRLIFRDKLARVLIDSPHLGSIHVAWNDGDFLLLQPLLERELRDRVDAPEGAVWMLWHIQQSGAEHHGDLIFYDQAFNLIDHRIDTDQGFDPRTRPWYDAALASNTHSITGPYVFFLTSEFGTTVARTSGLRTVVAADITLNRLSSTLSGHGTTESSELLVYDSEGYVLAYRDPRRIMNTAHGSALNMKSFNELGSTLLAALAADGFTVERRTVLELEGQRWIIMQRQLDLLNRKDTYLAILVPEAELLNSAYGIRRESLWMSLIFSLVLLPTVLALTVWLARRRQLSNIRRQI